MKVVEIDKNNFKNNIEVIKKITQESPNTKIYAVVKGNGGGLDIVKYSKFLIENGITSLAVATYEECLKLRNAEIKEEILMLSPVSIEEEMRQLVEKNIILTIGDYEELELLKKVSKDLNVEKCKAHLKIDTGFGRYGILYSNIEEIIKVLENAENIEIEGMFSHFSKAIDEKMTKVQFERFINVVKAVEEKNLRPKILHISSSTAFLKYPEMRLDAVRIGSLFQGRSLVKNIGLTPVGVLKSRITEIKTVPKGYTISYGNTYITKRETKLATIPIGHMDGLNKLPVREDFSLRNNIIAILMEIKKLFKDNSFKVKINNREYKILGRIGLCHVTVDITGSDDIKTGDEVILNVHPMNVNEEIRREYV